MSDFDLLLFARVVLGITFVLSGTQKIASRRTFLLILLEYHILPIRAARLYARLLPWAEVATGLLVLLGVAFVPSTIVLLLLLCSFGFATAINLLRGRRFPCGCFGSPASETIGVATLLRIGALVGLAAYIIGAGSFTSGTQGAPASFVGSLTTISVAAFILIAGYLGENLSVVRRVIFGDRSDGGLTIQTKSGQNREKLDVGTIPVEGPR